jgi:ATP-dependent Lon protease
MLKNLRDKIFNPEDEAEEPEEEITEGEQTSPEVELEIAESGDASDELPLLPLRGVVMYPTMWLPITVGQPRSLRLIDHLIDHDEKLIALAASLDPELKEPGPENIYRVGAVARIHRMVRSPDGTVRLVLHGVERIRIDEYTAEEPFLRVRFTRIPDQEEHDLEEQALAASAKDLFSQLVSLSPQMPEEMESAARNVEGELQLAYLLASSAGFNLSDAQSILEADPLKEKLHLLNALLRTGVEIRELAQKIQQEAQGEMERPSAISICASRWR